MLFMFVVVVIVVVNERTPDASASWADCERLCQLGLSGAESQWLLGQRWRIRCRTYPRQRDCGLVRHCKVQEVAGLGGSRQQMVARERRRRGGAGGDGKMMFGGQADI
jgi:hypothetical protein